MAEALLALDPPITPLVLGTKQPWTLSTFMLENVLPAVAGGQFYEDYFHGRKAADATEISLMLEEAGKLWAYMPSAPGETPGDMLWDQGIDYFVQGKAAMTVMGDWAKGAIDNNAVAIDYDQLPFPGTVGTFMYTADTFALPIGATSRTLAIDFLKTLASEEAQIAFNVKKGSSPPRALSNTDAFDEIAKRTIADLEASTGNQHLALSGLAPVEFSEPLWAAMQEFTFSCEAGSCDPAIVIAALAENYHRLQP